MPGEGLAISVAFGAGRSPARGPCQGKALHGRDVTLELLGGFFGADSLRIPELDEVGRRFGEIDLALLPINGLAIRPLGNLPVVMNAAEAAG
ncbi:hypothetical protein ETD86_48865 [Nonomuraea turkmeniaca]|uniref:Uncharacterized protein n=1 Tax=Nonomuraea turkmeniaca TaxID=103838 RepID=A0A5S4FGS6_9ACTN|nr:hypothetical protein [Nonomuraea turkmeniaca]TMR08185.1 hypothetical protein ETD86_48865 [Nonomuraea turkmeniaca]